MIKASAASTATWESIPGRGHNLLWCTKGLSWEVLEPGRVIREITTCTWLLYLVSPCRHFTAKVFGFRDLWSSPVWPFLPLCSSVKQDLIQSGSVGVRDWQRKFCTVWTETSTFGRLFCCGTDTGRGFSNGCPCLTWDICSCSTRWVQCVLPILLLPWWQLPVKLFMVLGKKWNVVLILKMSLIKCFM